MIEHACILFLKGFSLTLLKVTDDVIARLDADTDVAAWPRCVKDTAVHSAPQVLACELSGPTPFPSSLSGQVRPLRRTDLSEHHLQSHTHPCPV